MRLLARLSEVQPIAFPRGSRGWLLVAILPSEWLYRFGHEGCLVVSVGYCLSVYSLVAEDLIVWNIPRKTPMYFGPWRLFVL